MPSKQRPVRQIMPGVMVKDAAQDAVERRAMNLNQITVHLADGNEYGFTITNLQSQDLYRTQYNLNDRWAIGVMNALDPQVAGPGREGAKNNGNALFWRDLMLGVDRMYLDGDGQLRIQSASPAYNKVNDVLALQASSNVGPPAAGMGVGVVWEIPDVVGDNTTIAFTNAISRSVAAGAISSYFAITALNAGAGVEAVQIGGADCRWRVPHQGQPNAPNAGPFKLLHTTVNMAGGADVTLAGAAYASVTLEFTGLQTANNKAIVPVADHAFYILYNNTTGGFTVQLTGATGAGVTVGSGKKCLAICDGTNYVRVTADV